MMQEQSRHRLAVPAYGSGGGGPRRGGARHVGNGHGGAAGAISGAARRAVLASAMAVGAAGLTSIFVAAGALEFSEYGNPIVVAINIATCTVLAALLACAPLAGASAVRRRVDGLDRDAIWVRAMICVLVTAYAIVVFWAGPGYAASRVPAADDHLWTPYDGKSTFTATGRPSN